jgi:hypothetical protein
MIGKPQLMQVLVQHEVWFGWVHWHGLTYDPTMLDSLPNGYDDLIDPTAYPGIAAWEYRGEWWTTPVTAELTLVRGNVTPTRDDLPRLTIKPDWWVDDLDRVVHRLNHPEL